MSEQEVWVLPLSHLVSFKCPDLQRLRLQFTTHSFEMSSRDPLRLLCLILDGNVDSIRKSPQDGLDPLDREQLAKHLNFLATVKEYEKPIN